MSLRPAATTVSECDFDRVERLSGLAAFAHLLHPQASGPHTVSTDLRSGETRSAPAKRSHSSSSNSSSSSSSSNFEAPALGETSSDLAAFFSSAAAQCLLGSDASQIAFLPSADSQHLLAALGLHAVSARSAAPATTTTTTQESSIAAAIAAPADPATTSSGAGGLAFMPSAMFFALPSIDSATLANLAAAAAACDDSGFFAANLQEGPPMISALIHAQSSQIFPTLDAGDPLGGGPLSQQQQPPSQQQQQHMMQVLDLELQHKHDTGLEDDQEPGVELELEGGDESEMDLDHESLLGDSDSTASHSGPRGTSPKEGGRSRARSRARGTAVASQWADEFITMPLRDLNRYLKAHKHTPEEIRDLRVLRRRKKNRKYAEDARREQSLKKVQDDEMCKAEMKKMIARLDRNLSDANARVSTLLKIVQRVCPAEATTFYKLHPQSAQRDSDD